MDTKEIQKILIIGGGPTEIGHETELDAACVQIIQAFKKQYPDIDISVSQSSFNEIVENVKNGTLDLGFTVMPVSENLIVDTLVKDEIYCVAPKGFEPKNKKSVTHEDLEDRDFILQSGDYDRDTKAALDYYGIQPNLIHFSIDDQSIVQKTCF